MFKHCLNMVKQELIKPIVKLGNSACVLLPRAWIDGKARIELIEKPLDIKKDIFEILSPYLEDILGIYLIGSYAREEQTKKSDIDVLVITNKTDKRIEKGKYEIMLVSKKLVEEKMKKNIFPLLPMMIEAKPLLNSSLIEQYKDTKLTKKNLKWHIDTTKSAMNVVKEFINLAEDIDKKVVDAASYSLVLRLRTIYIINCLRKGKLWNKKEFLNLIKKISGSLIVYERYLDSKHNNSKEYKLPIEEAKKLMDYNNKEIREIEKWLKKGKD